MHRGQDCCPEMNMFLLNIRETKFYRNNYDLVSESWVIRISCGFNMYEWV